MVFKFKIYEIHEDGELMVASGEGNNKESIRKEMQHYAMQYAQDYPIRGWKNFD